MIKAGVVFWIRWIGFALITLSFCFRGELLFGQTDSVSPDEKEKAKVFLSDATGSLELDNLVAWCIVPFDAKQRTPEQRAQMLQQLGIKRCAYDWRQEHVAEFEAEILAYQEHNIQFFAFWGSHPQAFQLFAKYDLHPQIWQMIGQPEGETQQDKIQAAADSLLPLAKETQQLKCPLAIYNHGGWGGEPENMVAVCQRLNDMGYDHVGIVYNFHHGHGHIEDWEKHWKVMQPHVLCLNLNGMNPNEQPKILGLGQGKHELSMIRTVIDSGYNGPIGILDHRQQLDAAESLAENLRGIDWIKKELTAEGSGGPRPAAVEVAPTSQSTEKELALGGGRIVPGKSAYSELPILISCQATLGTKDSYNILVANQSKQSATHWEIFSEPGSGFLTAYLPGCLPDHVRSAFDVCDGKRHVFSLSVEPQRARLFVDGKSVADQVLKRKAGEQVKGPLGIGRTIESGLQCSGSIDWVKISALDSDAVRETGDLSQQNLKAEKTTETVGFWDFRREGEDGESSQEQDNQPSSDDSFSRFDWGLSAESPSEDQSKLFAEIVAKAKLEGDFQRGAEVFSSQNFACLSCHRVGEVGGIVGPELSRLLPERQPRQILQSLLWPGKEVDERYRQWQVLTIDGLIYQGTKIAEDQQQLTLFDTSKNQEVVIPKDDIEDLAKGSTSMPDGLLAGMTERQRLDLIRFLIDLGKDGNVPVLVQTHHVHSAAKLNLPAQPNTPENWPNSDHFVNRQRIYDFYTKQAEVYRQQTKPPKLLASYPGLDGSATGHWGNQDEGTWSDGRWNQTELGSVQCGVLIADGLRIGRAVCLRLGDHQEMSACFNPDTLSFDAVWKDGFVSFSSVRHGFMHGLQLEGQLLQPNPTAGDKGLLEGKVVDYHGWYRVGKKVVFSYSIDEVAYLDSAWCVDGKFVRERLPADQHSMRESIKYAIDQKDAAGQKNNTGQWPQKLETAIRYGQEKPYAVDTIELPFDNPWNALMFCGGHDFLPDGSVLVCTMHGDVWRVQLEEDSENANDGNTDAQNTGELDHQQRQGKAIWSRFAAGLHHALDVKVVDGQIFVQCRDQLTRLHDLNGDGEADFYECFSNDFETSPAGHDFICGLQCDTEGNFYTASGNQGLVKISPQGEASVMATGFRNPDGVGMLADGTITVPCSEGDWTPASMICAIEPDSSRSLPPHFGYGGPRNDQPPELPLVYMPRGLDNSSGGQALIGSEAFGPVTGSAVHTSFGAASWFRLLVEEVDGKKQGAIVPMRGDFESGAHRARFSPHDHQLYITGMNGWGSYGPGDGCFQRLRYTGDAVQTITDFRVHENGVRVSFSQAVDPSVAADVASHFAQCWNYRYSGGYGSPEYSPSHPGVEGHDRLEIASVHVLADQRDLFLEIPDLQPVNQLHLRMNVDASEAYHSVNPYGSGHDLYLTVHYLGEPFTEFPEYQPRNKIVAAHPILSDMALHSYRQENPWINKMDHAKAVEIQTGSNLTFQTRQFKVQANQVLAFTLTNPDVVPHNWVLVKPGTLQEVGQLSNRLITDPTAFARHYVPESDSVLNYTDIVAPGQSQTIYFRAPAKPGRYPFLCTFPGHWMVMNGEMLVVAPE